MLPPMLWKHRRRHLLPEPGHGFGERRQRAYDAFCKGSEGLERRPAALRLAMRQKLLESLPLELACRALERPPGGLAKGGNSFSYSSGTVASKEFAAPFCPAAPAWHGGALRAAPAFRALQTMAAQGRGSGITSCAC